MGNRRHDNIRVQLDHIARNFSQPDDHLAEEESAFLPPVSKASRRPRMNTSKPPVDLEKGTLYIYTDAGCSSRPKPHPQRGKHHYIGVEWVEELNGEPVDDFIMTFQKRPPRKLRFAANNAQMELYGIVDAFRLALKHFSERKVCILSDHQESVRIAKEYLATYAPEHNATGEERAFWQDRRDVMRAQRSFGIESNPTGMEWEYSALFDVLDKIGTEGYPITIERNHRVSDKWAVYVDQMAAMRKSRVKSPHR